MNRYGSINEALSGDSTNPEPITLYSELETGGTYTIDGNGPYSLYDVDGDKYIFKDSETAENFDLTRDEITGLINDGKVTKYVVPDGETHATIEAYPSLDKFTRNTFNTPTRELWDRTGIEQHFSVSELLDLDTLVRHHKLHDMPIVGQPLYDRLVESRHWKLLKRYMTTLQPDIELPDILA